ncbi:MAG: 2-C-methyl-D-erythritol 4-phosphate cytidylyltransferase [Deltaproteobacteria bacterium]|nr:2-C-methyl-D-erythritol 4-phosphate cytidylyltransferase [Deltaproteobacteria bacterium]
MASGVLNLETQTLNTPRTAAIIPAGGIGKRMGTGSPKQFCLLAGIPLLVHTVRAFAQVDAITAIIIAAPAVHLQQTRQLADTYKLQKVTVVAGGKLRQDSVKAGLAHVPPGCEFVAVHDGARPLITPALIRACLAEAEKSGAAMAAVAVKDTIKEVKAGFIRRTIDRETLWQAQTPQVVRTETLKKAFAQAEKLSFIGTDEASFLELINEPMAVVQGSEQNIKITRPEDLIIAEAILMQKAQNVLPGQAPALRVGHGYDAHRLAAGRLLVLGGVVIPHPTGLLGHSDADVLTHALCDAILGALGAGDIGHHFPDHDPAYKDIDSLKLLAQVMAAADREGYALVNADITVIAQEPKLAPHFPAMREKLATVCRTAESAINLKGTTTEKMGFTGRQEGIAAHAVVLLHQKVKDILTEP